MAKDSVYSPAEKRFGSARFQSLVIFHEEFSRKGRAMIDISGY